MSPLCDWLKRRKRKKKKVKKRSVKIKFDGDCAKTMKGSNSHVNSLKRIHLESGKRSRGRNRHSLSQVGGRRDFRHLYINFIFLWDCESLYFSFSQLSQCSLVFRELFYVSHSLVYVPSFLQAIQEAKMHSNTQRSQLSALWVIFSSSALIISWISYMLRLSVDRDHVHVCVYYLLFFSVFICVHEDMAWFRYGGDAHISF